MPGKKEDLRHAEAGADPDLNFSYNELMQELKAEFGYAARQPGDVTVREMADELGMSFTACRVILAKKVKAGELTRVKAKGIGETHYEFVYRKVKG